MYLTGPLNCFGKHDSFVNTMRFDLKLGLSELGLGSGLGFGFPLFIFCSNWINLCR